MTDRPLRCECTGQCGHNHSWTPERPAQQCRAPHGCEVQRKTDNPSSWILAGSERIPIVFAEFYQPRIETVTLEQVCVGVFRTEQTLKYLCGFCRAMLKKKSEHK